MRNRAKLLEAADQLYTRDGPDEVSLKDVARRAGVGVGTVYRHFPTKEDLLTALYAERVEVAVRKAEEAASDPDGWRGLVRFLDDFMAAQAHSCGLRGLMGLPEYSTPMVDEARETIAPLVKEMVARAQAQDTLRPDFDADDVTLIQVALTAVMDATKDMSPDVYRNQMALILDGMRAGTPSRPVHDASAAD